MNGWILYKETANHLKPESYEICRFLDVAMEKGIDLKIISPEEVDLIVTRDDRKSIRLNGEVQPLPHFFLPRMGAETTYFALAVIRHLERLGVPTFNSSQSIDIVKDKLYTQQILAASNLPIPKTMLVKYPVDPDLVEKTLGFPVIVKTLSGSQGSGVFLSENKNNFEDLMQFIHMSKNAPNIILQEFIENSRGRDLRVIVIGGRVIACMERSAASGNFKANFSAGGQVQAHEITPEIEWLAIESTRILNLDIAGIDLLIDTDHYKICEANSSPGFKGIEQCCEVNIAEEIYNYVRVRLGMF